MRQAVAKADEESGGQPPFPAFKLGEKMLY